MKSDAQSTIEFAIRLGLSENAHMTGVTITDAPIMVKDIMASLFSESTIWAVKEYLAELHAKSKS